MYKILGTDQKEYGPVTVEVVRQWIGDRRANSQTLVQAEGGDWKPLSQFPEFSDLLAAGASPPPQSVGYSSAPAVPAKVSVMAIVSLCLGVLGICSGGLAALVGLILGIIALVQINNSHGRLTGRGLAIAGICVSSLMILIFPALLLPAVAKAKQRAQAITCVSHLKQLALGLRMYANENKEEALPQASKWCDAILNEVGGSAKVFRCPSDPSGQRSTYGFNANLSGKSVGSLNPKTVMLFEIPGGWNVSGGPEAMIQKPRHGSYSIGFVDGSVEQVPATRLSQLRWNP